MNHEEWSENEHSEIVGLFLSYISKQHPDKQLEAIQRLIGGAVAYMHDFELQSTKEELESQFPPDLQFVASILDIINGQIALREMGYKPA